MVTGVESHEALRIRLRDERKTRKYHFKKMSKSIPENPLSMCPGKLDCWDDVLRHLKSQEPDSDNLFFRLAIIDYELGDVARSIVYSERFLNNVEESKKAMFRDGFKDKNVILAEGKLAMADTITQLHLLCISLGWNFGELRKLGAQHLEERQKDFKRDGWKEVEK